MTTAHHAISADSHHVNRFGNVTIESAVLFAGHAECPSCGAFVTKLTHLAARSVIGELVEGWCSVCGTSTFFLAA